MKKYVAFPLDIVEVKNTGHRVVTMEFHVNGLEWREKMITFQSPKFFRGTCSLHLQGLSKKPGHICWRLSTPVTSLLNNALNNSDHTNEDVCGESRPNAPRNPAIYVSTTAFKTLKIGQVRWIFAPIWYEIWIFKYRKITTILKCMKLGKMMRKYIDFRVSDKVRLRIFTHKTEEIK